MSARCTDARAGPARPASTPRKYIRYVGSRTNAHGLTAATRPRRNERPRFTRTPEVLGDVLAQLVGVERAGAGDDAAVGVDEEGHREGDDAELVGEGEVGIAQQLVADPPIIGEPLHRRGGVVRVDADEPHLVADLAVHGGEARRARGRTAGTSSTTG